ncbi:hypothetical protein H5T88_02980 [bacterium]|nr:hypothetical protein [bacterium]
MPSNWWRALFLSLLCILSFPQKKTIIFITEDIDFSEIYQLNYPAFSFLKEKASWGLLTRRRRSRLEVIISGISAGNYPLIKTSQVPLGFNVDEEVEGVKAKYLFYTRTGIMPPDNGVVQVAMQAIKMYNEERQSGATVGLLGSILRGAGYKTAIVGNSDGLKPRRLAVLVACDENGIVDIGDVGSDLLKKEPLSVAGKTMDIEKFRLELNRAKNASFIVIDSGEMGRFVQYEEFLSPQAYEIWRKDCLRRIDELLNEALRIYEKGDLFVFLSLIGTKKGEPDRLSTIAILNEGQRGKLLVSPSTRWKGLVSLQDIAPTVLSFFNLVIPSSMHGKPIESAEGNLQELANLFLSSTLEGASQPILLGVFLSLYLIGFFLTIFRITKYPFLFSLLFPSSLLLISLFSPSHLSSYIIIPILLTISLFFLLWFISLKAKFPLFRSIIIFLTGLIILDALTGGKLSLHSPLNVYSLGGCRFYGIGNEYGGILIATLPFAIFFLSQREFFLKAGILFSALCVLLPFWGSNLGVSLSLFLLFLLVSYYREGKRGLFISFTVLLALTIPLSVIALIGGSHIGQFARLVIKDAYQSFLLLHNKLLLNFSIVSESGWKAGVLVLCGLFLLALLRGIRLEREIADLYPPTFLALFFAFIINDTGAILILLAFLYLLAIFVLEGSMK